MFRFLHAADIHLDSPLRGLDRYQGAPVTAMRLATRQALQNLVDLALHEKVQFLLISGDLYDGDWKDYNTGLFFSQAMNQLREADIRVFIIAGNHDATSQVSKHLKMPDNVVIFSDQSPETHVLDELGVALHGQSFPRPVVSDDITVNYPSAITDAFNIGLLHTSLNGREGHASYAPCHVEGLCSKGYDYWALGHVHRREEVRAHDPIIVFPGNLQGRHIRETGAKGATLVEVNDSGVSPQHCAVDVFRWNRCIFDAGEAAHPYDILEGLQSPLQNILDASEGRPSAVRVQITGSTKVHSELMQNSASWAQEVRNLASTLGSEQLWIEKVQIQTKAPIDLQQLLQEETPLSHVLKTFNQLSQEDEWPQHLNRELRDLKRKIPLELQQASDSLNLDDPKALESLLEGAKQHLFSYFN